MMQLSSSLQLHGNRMRRSGAEGTGVSMLRRDLRCNGREQTEEVREKFTQFVGEAFYGQMFKAMRSTVGKPAYFHGGRAEEVFQGQLDQTMTEQLTKSTASKFAEPMFERQFPHLAESSDGERFGQLSQLSRR